MEDKAESLSGPRRRSFEMKRGSVPSGSSARGRRSYLAPQDTNLRSCYTAPQLSQGMWFHYMEFSASYDPFSLKSTIKHFPEMK